MNVVNHIIHTPEYILDVVADGIRNTASAIVYIIHVPEYIGDGIANGIRITSSGICSVIQTAEGAKTAFLGSSAWKDSGKPYFDRTFKPLNKTDYFLLGGSVALSVLFSSIFLTAYGISALSLTCGTSVAAMGGTWMYSSFRVRKHFDNIAWDRVDHLRRTVHTAAHNDPKTDEIEQDIGLLNKPEFKHHENDLTALRKEYEKFNRSILSRSFNDCKDIVISHIDSLKLAAAAEQDIVDQLNDLEEEINKVGTNQQDTRTLEDLKNELLREAPDDLKDDMRTLRYEVDDFVRAEPPLENVKKGFIEYLKQFQLKLAPSRAVEDLYPVAPVAPVPQAAPAAQAAPVAPAAQVAPVVDPAQPPAVPQQAAPQVPASQPLDQEGDDDLDIDIT